MTAMQQAQKYFDAWNAHDTDAIIAAFSDLKFEIVKEFECAGGAWSANG